MPNGKSNGPIDTFVSLTDAEIVARYSNGTLLAALRLPSDQAHQPAAVARLLDLHNAGSIDLLALTNVAEFSALDKRQFFHVTQVYAALLPKLLAATLAVQRAVEQFLSHPNRDGFSPLVAEAFRVWISQDINRAKDVLAYALDNAATDPEVLRTALVTTSDMVEVAAFLAMLDRRRQAAIAAIGGVTFADVAATQSALTILEAIIATDADEEMRFTATFAAFGLLQKWKTEAAQVIPRLIAAVIARPSEQTRTALLQGLWRNTSLFAAQDAELALNTVCDGDLPTPLVQMLGAALSQLIGGPFHDLGIEILTSLLASTGRAIPLDSLASLEHRLAALDRAQLFALAVKWFATRDQMLCEAVAKLVGDIQTAQPFDDTFANRGFTRSETLTICHKAFGYMLLAPVVAASFVVAALRAGDKSAEPDLVELLYQSALINYGDIVIDYLKGISKSDVAFKPVQKAIKLYRAYEKGLHVASPIKELM